MHVYFPNFDNLTCIISLITRATATSKLYVFVRAQSGAKSETPNKRRVRPQRCFQEPEIKRSSGKLWANGRNFDDARFASADKQEQGPIIDKNGFAEGDGVYVFVDVVSQRMQRRL